MKKQLFAVICALTLISTACTKPIPENPGETPDSPIVLSAAGTSNCYLVNKAGYYSFDATVRGNGATTIGLDQPKAIAADSAALVWQTTTGMIGEVTFKEGFINFKLADIKGNALIAATDSKGEILWSWHIWFPEEEPKTYRTKTGFDVMNMNLGAMTEEYDIVGADSLGVKPYGLLYQWGRKDPLPASGTHFGTTETVGVDLFDINGNKVTIDKSPLDNVDDNTISYSIAHPTTCMSNYYQYIRSRDWLRDDLSNRALWGNPLEEGRGVKSFYDPCPVGYRVPDPNVFEYATTSGGLSMDAAEFNVMDVNKDGVINAEDWTSGWYIEMEDGYSLFPAAARYDGSYAMLYGSKSGLWGSYWGNAGMDSDYGSGLGVCVLSFQNEYNVQMLSPWGAASRADAYSVRCIKE